MTQDANKKATPALAKPHVFRMKDMRPPTNRMSGESMPPFVDAIIEDINQKELIVRREGPRCPHLWLGGRSQVIG